jgi:hypothetical protein
VRPYNKYGRIHDEKRSSGKTCGLGAKIDQGTIKFEEAEAERSLFHGVKDVNKNNV